MLCRLKLTKLPTNKANVHKKEVTEELRTLIMEQVAASNPSKKGKKGKKAGAQAPAAGSVPELMAE